MEQMIDISEMGRLLNIALYEGNDLEEKLETFIPQSGSDLLRLANLFSSHKIERRYATYVLKIILKAKINIWTELLGALSDDALGFLIHWFETTPQLLDMVAQRSDLNELAENLRRMVKKGYNPLLRAGAIYLLADLSLVSEFYFLTYTTDPQLPVRMAALSGLEKVGLDDTLPILRHLQMVARFSGEPSSFYKGLDEACSKILQRTRKKGLVYYFLVRFGDYGDILRERIKALGRKTTEG